MILTSLSVIPTDSEDQFCALKGPHCDLGLEAGWWGGQAGHRSLCSREMI